CRPKKYRMKAITHIVNILTTLLKIERIILPAQLVRSVPFSAMVLCKQKTLNIQDATLKHMPNKHFTAVWNVDCVKV
ncbi:MAG: hypothetical protein LBV02_06485, partial [Bacteroidales bacterium]|nr:hypothetical protein [Bacteroidales bacterium]